MKVIFRKIIAFFILIIFLLNGSLSAYTQSYIGPSDACPSALSVFSSIVSPDQESPKLFRGDLLANKHFVLAIMSIANYILRQNGTIEDLPKWIRHHLTEEYSDWINLIDLEKSEKSHSELKLYLNYGQRSVRAEISLQENRPEKEEIFRIKIKETGFGQNSKDSPREDVILKDRGNIVEIGFSVLSSDPDKIIEEVQEVVDAGIDSIHVDHLDGVFTPGLPAFDCTDQIKKINGISVPLNVHLMAMSPSKELINKIIDSGLKSGRDSILVHYEAFNEAGDMDVIVKHIKEKGFKAGISINPETSIADLRNTLNRLNGYVSSVMVMSIIPGAGSRPFIKGTEEKVKDLDSLLVSMGIRSGIQIILDGGLNERSLGAIVETGADEIITRTWLLTNGPNYRKSLESIKNLSCHRIESIALNDLIEEWGLLNYNFIIDAIVRFCSGDKIFTKEEIISTVKRYYGVNKVLINEDKVVDIFYDDKLVRFHKDGILPIEHLGLRDRTYYDGIVVKIYTGNVVAEQKGEYILGISGSWHDSTAALIKDGKIVCALEEERMTRVKHDTSMFPVNAILRMMEDIGITWEDIKHISLGWNFNLYVDTPHSINPNSVLFREIDEKYARGKDIKIEDIVKRQNEEKNKERFNVKKIYGFLKEMSEYFGTKYEPRVSFVEHSRSHASSAYYLCGFEGKVLTLSLDGYGGFESGSVWLCENGTMKELTRFSLPHSIGWMWCAITEYMGFMPSADEGQIMGFAPYGEPWDSAEMERVNKLREIFKDYMRFDTKQEKLISNPENYYYGEMVEGKTRITKSFRKKMEELGICPYGRATHQIDPKNPEDRAYANLAFVLQERTSQVICDIVRYYFREKVSTKGIEKLALAGGVALNILSNGKLITEGLVYGENIFVQPAAGDSGVSLGSSLTVAREIYGDDVNVEMKHALYGPEYSNEEIRGTLEEFGLTEGIDYVTATDEKLVKYAADFINKEKAIAWFQGKSEIGPRALGARSILLNLNDVQANNTANIIKGRQPWRPSASSIAEEYAKDYFMGIGKSPFMIVAFPILFSKKNIVLSGMHEFGDKLARPQTVSKETNPLYWELLTRLGEISNIPAVVNTSFNKQEPLVENPEEALNALFYMDMVEKLFIGNFVVTKTDNLRPKIISLGYEKVLQTLIKEAVASGDINVWNKVFGLVRDLYPECHKIEIVMDCGKYGSKRFEMPLVKELFSGSMQEHILRYVASSIFNGAIMNSAEKVYIGSTSKKMEKVIYDLLKDSLIRDFPRMKYFSNYGKEMEIIRGQPEHSAARNGDSRKVRYVQRFSSHHKEGRFIGIDVGATGIKCVLMENGIIVKRENIPTVFNGGEELGRVISSAAEEMAGEQKINGIGIALPGVIDPSSGDIKWLVNYEYKWIENNSERGIIEEYSKLVRQIMSLKETVGCGNIKMINDGGAFAISEFNRSEDEDIEVLVLGTGIGAGRIHGNVIDISRIEQSGALIVNVRKEAEFDPGCELKGCFSEKLKDSAGALIDPKGLAHRLVAGFKLLNTLNGDKNFVLTGGITSGHYGETLMDEINEILKKEHYPYNFKVRLSSEDRLFGGAIGAAQLTMSLNMERIMELIHAINMSMIRPEQSKRKINYVISEDLIPLVIRSSFKHCLREMYRKYPFLKEKEEIKVVNRDDLGNMFDYLSSGHGEPEIITVALSNKDDIQLLPKGAKALVFSGSNEMDNFMNIEGIIAALRTLHQEDVHKLMRIYRYLSGKDFDLENITEQEILDKLDRPAELAEILTIKLRTENDLVDAVGLNKRLLKNIEEAA